jgi:hypothetical protein
MTWKEINRDLLGTTFEGGGKKVEQELTFVPTAMHVNILYDAQIIIFTTFHIIL